MRHHLRRSYTGYSIGCGIVWAAILGGATIQQYDTRRLWLVFGGWVSGWTSATIARYVYPPPAPPTRRTGGFRVSRPG